MGMVWSYNDGGRARAGFKGSNGDCVARAIAIATGMPYEMAYRMVDLAAREENRDFKDRSDSQTGVYSETQWRLLTALGWVWVPKTGRGRRKMYLMTGALPTGALIVSLDEHLVAVIDGILHDTYDSSHGGTERVLGYWRKA